MTYGIYVWDPDGDMGDGAIVGPYHSQERAVAKADRIRAAVEQSDSDAQVVVVVVDVLNGLTSERNIVRMVTRS